MLLCICVYFCYVTLDIDFVSSAILSESCHFGFHLIVYARNFVISSVNLFSGHANFSLSFFRYIACESCFYAARSVVQKVLLVE